MSARPKFSGAPQTIGCCYPHCSRPHCSQKNAGFTLTEVLVVAVVIGVLLSFVTAGAFSALTRGQEFAIQAEVGKLALAMEAFKQEYGSYPPANLTPPSNSLKKDRLYSFVARTFPRYIERLATDPDLEGSIQQRVRNDLQGTQGNGGKGIFLGDAPDEFNPAHALMFWLVGFSNDPSDPFAGHRERMKGDDLADAFYDFDPENIGHGFYNLSGDVVSDPNEQENDATLTAVYIPNKQAGGLQLGEINQTAVLYFDSTCYAGSSPQTYKGFSAYTTADGREIKPRSFQIINAGLDRKLGSGGASRGGADADNVAHFSRQLMGDRGGGTESG
ncbi:MAG: prepilin-type N-terminal cleavage/methylation domain-containing protein [Pirellulales bacterium]|nr:prepilin-type N-terminal cleavage/methylation domain-containing protein [Pirellulales bacterium]